MDTINVNSATYYLPENEDDVITLVNQAKTQNKIICLRGSAHSFPLINTLEAEAASNKNLYILLAKMNDVKIDKDNASVWVQGGCHLGVDPFDPTEMSNLQNSLLFQLNEAGLALPDLGGITHQTVAGFLSTGSSGGSVQFSFDDALMSISLITCGVKGAEKVTFNRPMPDNPDDPFYGIGVATLGLFGVIVSATFKCVPAFNIVGTETTSTEAECPIDLFHNGSGDKPSLQTFLEQTQYVRLMWWPQRNVAKMVVWQAKQQAPTPDFKIIPYQEVPWIAGSAVPVTLAADLVFSAIGTWPDWLMNAMGDTPKYRDIKTLAEAAFYPAILPLICKAFVQEGENQSFQDVWYNGIPMDNQMSDRLMPVWFTELWIPIEKTQEVMTALLNFYSEGPTNTGAFSCEIYATKSSPFWMSPAYQTNVIRIDVFWFANNNGNPVDFYKPFWALLQQFNYRPHWAKYLPAGDSAQGVTYLQSVYPKWNNWMALREQMDPGQVFVSDYWRGHLGIAPVQ
jgi:hypothetical protein